MANRKVARNPPPPISSVSGSLPEPRNSRVISTETSGTPRPAAFSRKPASPPRDGPHTPGQAPLGYHHPGTRTWMPAGPSTGTPLQTLVTVSHQRPRIPGSHQGPRGIRRDIFWSLLACDSLCVPLFFITLACVSQFTCACAHKSKYACMCVLIHVHTNPCMHACVY